MSSRGIFTKEIEALERAEKEAERKAFVIDNSHEEGDAKAKEINEKWADASNFMEMLSPGTSAGYMTKEERETYNKKQLERINKKWANGRSFILLDGELKYFETE